MIRVYDSVFTPRECSEFRDYFEQASSQWTREGRLDALSLRDPGLQTLVQERVRARVEDYGQQLEVWSYWPQGYALETARIKRYSAELAQHFPPHVDVDQRANCSRFLAILVYLNDSDAGTEFLWHEQRILAREGRMVLFPPFWTYPHLGELPTEGYKYILSTYLHYAE